MKKDNSVHILDLLGAIGICILFAFFLSVICAVCTFITIKTLQKAGVVGGDVCLVKCSN